MGQDFQINPRRFIAYLCARRDNFLLFFLIISSLTYLYSRYVVTQLYDYSLIIKVASNQVGDVGLTAAQSVLGKSSSSNPILEETLSLIDFEFISNPTMRDRDANSAWVESVSKRGETETIELIIRAEDRNSAATLKNKIMNRLNEKLGGEVKKLTENISLRLIELSNLKKTYLISKDNIADGVKSLGLNTTLIEQGITIDELLSKISTEEFRLINLIESGKVRPFKLVGVRPLSNHPSYPKKGLLIILELLAAVLIFISLALINSIEIFEYKFDDRKSKNNLDEAA